MIRLPLPAIFIWLSLGAIAGWWLHNLYHYPENRATDSVSSPMVADTNGQASEDADEKNFSPEIHTLIERGDYELALSRVNEKKRLGTTEASKDQATLISSLKKLSAEEPDKARPILKQLLDSDAYNPRAMFLLGKAYFGTGQHMRALETLFELKRLAQIEVSMEDIDLFIKKVESEYVKQLEDQEQLGELLQLYEFLTRQDPDTVARFYKLAKSQQRLNHHYDALNSLNYVLFDPLWGKLAQSMIEEIQKSIDLNDNVQIPLQRNGSHFVVIARINGIDGARMMIDTGASLCVLRPQSAHQFGLPVESEDRVVLNMVSSIFNSPRIEIDSISIGDVELRNIKATIIEMPPGSDNDGLLGMNFLSQFNFFIDQTKEILYLSSR